MFVARKTTQKGRKYLVMRISPGGARGGGAEQSHNARISIM